MDDLIQKIYLDVKQVFFVNYKGVDASNIALLTVHVMQAVEVVPGLTGDEKKAIVLKVIEMIVADSPLSDSTKQLLDLFIENTLPIVIDLIVNAASGSFNINTVGAWFKRHCCCTPAAAPAPATSIRNTLDNKHTKHFQ